jgi:hypothetical protein
MRTVNFAAGTTPAPSAGIRFLPRRIRKPVQLVLPYVDEVDFAVGDGFCELVFGSAIALSHRAAATTANTTNQ